MFEVEAKLNLPAKIPSLLPPETTGIRLYRRFGCPTNLGSDRVYLRLEGVVSSSQLFLNDVEIRLATAWTPGEPVLLNITDRLMLNNRIEIRASKGVRGGGVLLESACLEIYAAPAVYGSGE